MIMDVCNGKHFTACNLEMNCGVTIKKKYILTSSI